MPFTEEEIAILRQSGFSSINECEFQLNEATGNLDVSTTKKITKYDDFFVAMDQFEVIASIQMSDIQTHSGDNEEDFKTIEEAIKFLK